MRKNKVAPMPSLDIPAFNKEVAEAKERSILDTRNPGYEFGYESTMFKTIKRKVKRYPTVSEKKEQGGCLPCWRK